MTRMFTKRFSRLSDSDQAALVDAVVRDLRGCVGRHVNPEDDRKVEQQIKRIEERAVQNGVYTE